MAKFNVSLDLLLGVVVEVEADNEHEAVDLVWNMPRTELLRLADTDGDTIGINEHSIIVDPVNT